MPLHLISTVELTNFAFAVHYPAERFTNLVLLVNTQAVSVPVLELLTNGKLQVSFMLPADHVLHGPTNVAQLCFTAFTNQSSAFVPLEIADVEGLRPDGNLVANARGQSGRVAVVGKEPLLEAWGVTNGQYVLLLYGQPGSSSRLLMRTNQLTDGTWIASPPVAQTNLLQVLGPFTPTNGAMFFRAVKP